MRNFITLLLLTCSFSIFAQRNNIDVSEKISYVAKRLDVKKYHNSHDLTKIKKSVLIQIYYDRLRIYNELLPYLAIKAGPGDELQDLQTVPYTKKREKRVKFMMKKKTKYHDNLKATISSELVYADSKDIIWGIVFMDALIGEMMEFLQRT